MTPPNQIYAPNGLVTPKGIAHIRPLLMRFYIICVILEVTIRSTWCACGVETSHSVDTVPPSSPRHHNIYIYRGNYNYDLSLRPRKTQRVNSTTLRSRRFLKSFPIFSNRRHVFRRLCPIRGPFIALRQCRRRVNSTTPRSRFLSASPQFATVPALE